MVNAILRLEAKLDRFFFQGALLFGAAVGLVLGLGAGTFNRTPLVFPFVLPVLVLHLWMLMTTMWVVLAGRGNRRFASKEVHWMWAPFHRVFFSKFGIVSIAAFFGFSMGFKIKEVLS